MYGAVVTVQSSHWMKPRICMLSSSGDANAKVQVGLREATLHIKTGTMASCNYYYNRNNS